jgi:hypothetical protein
MIDGICGICLSFFFLPEVAGLQGLLSQVLSLVSDGLRLLGLPSVICGFASGFCAVLPADQGIAFITSILYMCGFGLLGFCSYA